MLFGLLIECTVNQPKRYYRCFGRRRASAWTQSEVSPSAHRAVRRRRVAAAEDDLEEVDVARAEPRGAHQQVVAPDAAEALAVLRLQRRPRRGEVAVPRHQRGVVVRAEGVQVFEGEEPLHGAGELGDGRELAVREGV